jgi:uncharacterized membrane protein
MIMLSRYGALWIRGFWVYVILIVINVVVGLVGAGIARLLASRLPRLRRSSQVGDATV